MSNLARSSILITAFLLGFGKYAAADEFHYNNLLIGDRASGMGGAYTAISDDATGMYYNPAGIAYVGDKNFSASVNTYNSQSKKYDNVIGGQPFERKSSALLANFFGIVKPLGKFKLGFSYAVPDAVNEVQIQTFDNVSTTTSRFTINLNNKDNTFNYGPTLAYEILDDLSVGVTLYVHQREAQLIVNQFKERIDATNSNQWTNYNYRLSEKGVRPILGVAWSPVEKLSLGLSLSQTIVFTSDAVSQTTCWDASGYVANTSGCNTNVTAPSIQAPKLTNYSSKRQYPISTAIGAAYFASSSLILSGDFSYHTAVTDPTFGDKVATMNAALGTEYYLSKKWAVRAGLFTNRANTPAIRAGVTQIEEHINIYGASLSVSNFSGSSSVTLGTSISGGKGQSQITGDSSVQNASTLGWLFFLSSSY